MVAIVRRSRRCLISSAVLGNGIEHGQENGQLIEHD
jgi:hypothetical protein